MIYIASRIHKQDSAVLICCVYCPSLLMVVVERCHRFSFFLQHRKTCLRPLDSKTIHQFYISLNSEGFICYPLASSVFSKGVGCWLLPVYLFWNGHTTRNIMEQGCTLYSIKTTHVPSLEYFMAGGWGVDIAPKKTGRIYSCIYHVTADCLCFPCWQR